MKYNELEYQLKGLKLAIDNIENGIRKKDTNLILIEVNYFDEKQRRVKSLIQDLIIFEYKITK